MNDTTGRRPPTETSDGRRVFLLVSVSIVAISGVLGVFIGENGKQVASSVHLFGLLTLPTTPLAFSLYGMVLSTAVLVALFGLVEFASRYDEA